MGPAKDKRKKRRIAIVGGGMAGLSAAWYLKKNGYENVTLFESEPEVGGKCVTYDIDGKKHDISAILLMANYEDLFDIADEIGVTYSAGIKLGNYQTDLNGGEYLFGRDVLKHDGYSTPESIKAGVRYLLRSLIRYRKFNVPSNGLLHAPRELKQSVETFLRQQKFEPLIGPLTFAMTSLGYGRLDQVPAAYLTKYIDWKSFISVMVTIAAPGKFWPKTFDDGFQYFLKRLAWKCLEEGVDIRLNSAVTGIFRPLRIDDYDAQVMITTTPRVNSEGEPDPNGELDPESKFEQFDELILSCQLDFAALKKIGLKMTPIEEQLFQRVRPLDFLAITCRTEHLPDGVVAVMPPPPRGQFQLYVQQHPKAGITTFYIPLALLQPNLAEDPIVGDPIPYLPVDGEGSLYDGLYGVGDKAGFIADDGVLSQGWEEKFYNIVKEQVSKMPSAGSGQPRVLCEPLIDGKLYKAERWKYFPRFELQDFADDAYERLESLQGVNNTYFNSSLLSMEICGPTASYARHLIDEQFPA